MIKITQSQPCPCGDYSRDCETCNGTGYTWGRCESSTEHDQAVLQASRGKEYEPPKGWSIDADTTLFRMLKDGEDDHPMIHDR